MHEIDVLYGKFDGTNGQFTRDPSGYLMIEGGIFRKHNLDVRYRYVQGTGMRYRELERGTANIALVLGRTALENFLNSGTTRLIGSSINSCPYRLVVQGEVRSAGDLLGKSLACRESTARISSLADALHQWGNLTIGKDIALITPETDKEALDMLFQNDVHASLLPQPYAIIAEERGFRTLRDWPEVVDDPLALVIETTESQFRERPEVFRAFREAYREGVAYLKNNRDAAIRMLRATFGQSPVVAAKAFEDLHLCLNDTLTVDMKELEKLLADLAPGRPGGARQLASEWIVA